MTATRIAVVLGALLVSVAAPGQSIRRLDGTRIAAEFAAKTLAEHHVTGAQIVVLNNGKTVWSYAYGLRHKDPDQPMTTETTTWAASITKAVFATYVMQLVERHQFDLDKPIAQQLPKPLDEYEAYKEAATELVKDPRWAKVTPRMCLSHTSGLLNNARMQEPGQKLRFHFEPGDHYSYSGEGINLVQFVLEQQQGKTLDLFMQDALFGPLGMTRTSEIYQKRFAEDVADRFDSDEKFHAQTRRFPARAAGNMTSSAGDLGRFAEALFAGKVIGPKTQRQMLTPQIPIRTLHQFAFRKDEPEGVEAKQVGLAYGIGWGLLTHTRYGPAFFKEGHGDGAQNYMVCFTRRKGCMIVLTNSDNGELAFRPLLEKILGDTVTPWEWESYTPSAIAASRANN
ncbi:penicillin-binding protein, beta-lactamase class C [Terriglobus roseus DSM 18391]|uniref:Penicillin-binding protein, beta-lactamase class C n=1 Tax=Terriglobus roseus (strain DSM 18391 / NRRL B-41598 / KBS 63) TaxID=926566 RepID=I3ZC79_TERRK|nr:serine hydrolase domain-containing protein [Terriglobus roseus]AFL86847.1 penicillin-binding protein, beta-lactamase class C [Terriglobus roseus DSM 18391]